MSDRQFTLFELTINEPTVQLGPRSLGGLGDLRSRLGGGGGTDETDGTGDAGETAADADATDDADADGELAESAADADGSGASGGSLLGKLVRLGLLAAVAVAAKKLVDEDDGGYDMDNVTDLGVVTDRGSESGSDEDAVPIEVTDGESDERDRSRTAAVLGLVVLVAAAVAAKRLLGGDELAELEELDEVAAEP